METVVGVIVATSDQIRGQFYTLQLEIDVQNRRSDFVDVQPLGIAKVPSSVLWYTDTDAMKP